jgi:hypothetical protein
MYSNSKDQLSLEESYRVVHNPEVIEEDQFETVANLPAAYAIFAGLGITGLVKFLMTKKKEEIEQLKQDPEFMECVKKLKDTQEKIDNANNIIQRAKNSRDVDTVQKYSSLLAAYTTEHHRLTQRLKTELKDNGYPEKRLDQVTDLFKKNGI